LHICRGKVQATFARGIGYGPRSSSGFFGGAARIKT
jgi:hypothetical protein